MNLALSTSAVLACAVVLNGLQLTEMQRDPTPVDREPLVDTAAENVAVLDLEPGGGDGAGDSDSDDAVGFVASDDEPQVAPWTALATITAYSYESCSTRACTTASGVPTRIGGVAVDPRYIPLGSLLEIEGLSGTYQAIDTGGGVRGWWVDRWVSSTAEARAWGRQTRAIRVTRWGR